MVKASLGTGAKYELLMATARHRTCYNPACNERLLVERAGKAVVNFEFAHIRDEQQPEDPDADIGWRYWPDDLTIDQRNHFSNVVLLCTPCHKLVDKIDPRSYSTTLLSQWKTDAEGADGAVLAATVGSMTAEALEEVVLAALQRFVPTRDVRVTLAIALIDDGGAILLPVEHALDMIAANPRMREMETAIAVEATNHGELSASVVAFDLQLRRGGREVHPTLTSPNPVGINPTLPVEIGSGSKSTWLFHTVQLRATISEFGAAAVFTDVAGIARLATGETCQSAMVGVEDIPMWDDAAQVAAVVSSIREADTRDR